jgi:hypothetical protein
MSETPALLDFSDADLKATLRRALKLTASVLEYLIFSLDGSRAFNFWRARRSRAQDCTSGNS